MEFKIFSPKFKICVISFLYYLKFYDSFGAKRECVKSVFFFLFTSLVKIINISTIDITQIKILIIHVLEK